MRPASRRARAAIALGLALLASAPAAAGPSADPRFELLGVLRRLAAPPSPKPAEDPQGALIEERFGRFRSRPAVSLYRDLLADPSREEAAATTMLYLSPPPDLALLDADADVHFVNGPGEAEEMSRFLSELRRFARETDFEGFYRSRRPYYAEREEAARPSLGGIDPVAEIERYLGVSLSARAHYILLPKGAVTHAFILPYPLPPANSGASSFDAYTLSPDLAEGGFASVVWAEPLFVFVDPSFYYFEKLNVPEPAAFYGPRVAACRARSPDCVKHLAVSALIDRLERRLKISPPPGRDASAVAPEDARLIRALSDRLAEYEADRARWPTLWSFYPRWLSVFDEAAHPGKAPRRLAVPREPAIAAAADFFKPSVYGALLSRAGAR